MFCCKYQLVGIQVKLMNKFNLRDCTFALVNKCLSKCKLFEESFIGKIRKNKKSKAKQEAKDLIIACNNKVISDLFEFGIKRAKLFAAKGIIIKLLENTFPYKEFCLLCSN